MAVLVLAALGLTWPLSFNVSNLSVALDASSYTIESLRVTADGFDFLPPADFSGSHRLGDVTFRVRDAGSTGMAYRTLTSATRPDAAKPLSDLKPGELAAVNLTGTLSASNDEDTMLRLERRFAKATNGAGLLMTFTLTNGGASALEVGAWGAAMVFQVMGVGGNKNLDELAASCSMVDPAIAGSAGFVSVTRMTGKGPVLVVYPKEGIQAWRHMTEASGGMFFEATSHTEAYATNEWKQSDEQFVPPSSVMLPAGASATFSYEFVLASSVRGKDAALARVNAPVLQAVPSLVIATDMTNASLSFLPPRGAKILGVSAAPAGAISLGIPTPIGSQGFYTIGVAGLKHGRATVTIKCDDGSASVASYFVLPPLNAHVASYGLFNARVAWYANESDPFGRGSSVLAYNRWLKKHIGVGPWDGGYEDNRIFNNGLSDEAGAGAHVGFASRVMGTPTQEEVSQLDKYVTRTLYGVKEGLPFGASLQCVEGGEASEKPSCGPPAVVGPTADGIMASMFWVPTNTTLEPPMPGYDYNQSWFCTKDCPPGWPGWRWDQSRAASLGRAYNYPHQNSVYMALYHASRNYDLLKTAHAPTWYLNRSYRTIKAMYYQASWYAHQGLMDGTSFRDTLQALRDESMHYEADEVEGIMRNRTLVGVENQCRYYVTPTAASANAARIHATTPLAAIPGYAAPPEGAVIHDRGNKYPGCHWYLKKNVTVSWASQTGLPGAGSEFAWDTTGQEEAYVWGSHFGADALAQSALDQILAYTPLVPNWAWHGSAYGTGDFGNNGFVRFNGGTERVLQHYRAGLNAIPTSEAFMARPGDIYLLRLAAGSIGGVLANIEVGSGAPSMGFHSDPSNLFYDPASGDYGLAFFGHVHTTASYLVRHPDLGWQCFFCDLGISQLSEWQETARNSSSASSRTMHLLPRDSLRRRVYLAPLGLLISSDAGEIAWVRCVRSPRDDSELTGVIVGYARRGAQPLSRFRLRLEARSGSRVFSVAVRGGASIGVVRGAHEIEPRQDGSAEVSIVW